MRSQLTVSWTINFINQADSQYGHGSIAKGMGMRPKAGREREQGGGGNGNWPNDDS